MPNYKNKQTGEVKHFAKIRTYINGDGTTYDVNLEDTNFDMTDWVVFSDEPTTSYKTIRKSKSKTDGSGIR